MFYPTIGVYTKHNRNKLLYRDQDINTMLLRFKPPSYNIVIFAFYKHIENKKMYNTSQHQGTLSEWIKQKTWSKSSLGECHLKKRLPNLYGRQLSRLHIAPLSPPLFYLSIIDHVFLGRIFSGVWVPVGKCGSNIEIYWGLYLRHPPTATVTGHREHPLHLIVKFKNKSIHFHIKASAVVCPH